MHASDTWRADILFKYGGVYADTDAIFVRPLSKELRAYDVVLSYDFAGWHQPFPDIVNNGIMVSKPGARFMELFLVLYILSAVKLITNLALTYILHCLRLKKVNVGPTLRIMLCHSISYELK